MLRLENVKKMYKTRFEEVWALRGVSLEIEKGDLVVIMGPSGSGKSTLLHVVAFLDEPTEGKRYLFGEDKTRVGDVEAARLRRDYFSFVFQEFNLIPEMTVFENVALPLVIKDVAKAEIENRVKAALERVGIADKADRAAYQLSGGERQRVAIARAFATGNPVLVMDEPTGNLDKENEQKIAELVLDFHREGGTVIVATHSERFARMLGGKLLRIEDGRLS